LNKQQDQQKIGIQYIYMLLPELVSADLICGNKKELLNNDISAIQHYIILYTFVHIQSRLWTFEKYSTIQSLHTCYQY